MLFILPAFGLSAWCALSLPQAVALADRVSAVSVARASAQADATRASLAGAPASPVLGFGTTRYSGKQIFSVAEDLRWAGQRRFEVLAARLGAEGSAAQSRLAESDARRAVRGAWLELAGAEDAEALALEVLTRARALEHAVGERMAGGRVPRLDLVRSRAETALIAADATAARTEREAAWTHLALLVGLDARLPGRTDGSRPRAPERSTLARLAAPERVETHPAVEAASAALRAAQATTALAGRRRLPGLNLEGGFAHGDPGLPGTDPQIALFLKIPVGGSGKLAEIAAQADERAAAARLEGERRDRSEALAVAYRRALGAQARFESYEAAAVPAATEAAQLTREAYEAGRGDVVRVIEAERVLLEARGARLQAYQDLQLAHADLLAAGGEDDHP